MAKKSVIEDTQINDWLDKVRKELGVDDGTSVKELLELLNKNQREKAVEVAKKKINNWEEFIEMLEVAFPRSSEYHEMLDEPIFQFENFFPDEKHDVGEGAWIKVPTEIGFNVYFAKPTKKKFDTYSMERKIKRLKSEVENVVIEALQALDASKEKIELLNKEVKLRKEILDLTIQLSCAEMFSEIEMTPYCVKYQVSKTRWVTLYPYQYELASDIGLYVESIIEIGKTEALTYKSIFPKGRVPDSVFYLQSRGISKETAIMMSMLRDCYFIFNTQEALKRVYGVHDGYMMPVK